MTKTCLKYTAFNCTEEIPPIVGLCRYVNINEFLAVGTGGQQGPAPPPPNNFVGGGGIAFGPYNNLSKLKYNCLLLTVK